MPRCSLVELQRGVGRFDERQRIFGRKMKSAGPPRIPEYYHMIVHVGPIELQCPQAAGYGMSSAPELSYGRRSADPNIQDFFGIERECPVYDKPEIQFDSIGVNPIHSFVAHTISAQAAGP